MGIYWLCCLAAIHLGFSNGIGISNDAYKNGEMLIDRKKATENVGALVGELDKQKGVTFNWDYTVLNDILPLVTFGRVYDYYEKMLKLSENIHYLEAEKKKIAARLDEEIYRFNAQMDQKMQSNDPSIRKMSYNLSGDQGGLYKLSDELKNEKALRTLKSKLPTLTEKQIAKWEQLKELKKNVEALKKQDAYDNFSNRDQVDDYMMEYEKAKTLTSCKEYIAKAIKAIDTDHYEAQKINAVLSYVGLKSMNLEELKKKLSGENDSKNAKYLLEELRTIKYLHDFTANELDKFGPEQLDMNSYDVIINIIKVKKEKRKADIIAKIIQRLAQIRDGHDWTQHEYAYKQLEPPNIALSNTGGISTFNPLERELLKHAQDKLRTREPSQENQQPSNEEYFDRQNVKAQPIYPQLDQLAEEQQQLQDYARMQTMGLSEKVTTPSAPYMDERQLYQYYQQQQTIDQARARAQQELAMQQFGFKTQPAYPQWQQPWGEQPQFKGYSGMRITPSAPFMDQQQLYHYYQQQQGIPQRYIPYHQGNPYDFQYYNRYPFPLVRQFQS